MALTRRRGNAFSLLQQSGLQAHKNGTREQTESVPTPARGNQKKIGFLMPSIVVGAILYGCPEG